MEAITAEAAAAAPRHKQAQVVKVVRLLGLCPRLLPLGVVGFQEGRVHVALRTCHTHKESSVCRESRGRNQSSPLNHTGRDGGGERGVNGSFVRKKVIPDQLRGDQCQQMETGIARVAVFVGPKFDILFQSFEMQVGYAVAELRLDLKLVSNSSFELHVQTCTLAASPTHRFVCHQPCNTKYFPRPVFHCLGEFYTTRRAVLMRVPLLVAWITA